MGAKKTYSDQQLLKYLLKFDEKEGRIPEARDFVNNPEYPGFYTYMYRFGSWNNAIQMAGLNINSFRKITDNELLEYLKRFYRENNQYPTSRNFNCDNSENQRYPSVRVYISRFGTWNNALKLAGLNKDMMIKNGLIENSNDKGRLFELLVKEHFKEGSIDLAGENHCSVYDGICPTKQTYNVKSSALRKVSMNRSQYWSFYFKNIENKTEWYYLGGFNENYENLMYVWRIPGDIVENWIDDGNLHIGISDTYTHNIENMKKYEITDKFKESE